MKTLQQYLKRSEFLPQQINEQPAQNLQLVITIPCYNEPDILISLQSLADCTLPEFSTEVVTVINYSESASEEIKSYNLKTVEAVQEFASNYNKAHGDKLRFYTVPATDLPKKHAGVGLARKIAMDEAVRRFVLAENPNGIIAGFDADAVCSANYLIEIENTFNRSKNITGASIYFEHPIEGNEFEAENYRRIIQYELYLRYYRWALKFTGHPHAFHTIGSSFAVTAQAYCKQGGMNRRQAGEDFYFLQKIIQLGNYTEINTATVFPSPRPSDRVPFGTGAEITKMLKTDSEEYLVYPPELFLHLKAFFAIVHYFYASDLEIIRQRIDTLHPILVEFLNLNEFEESVAEAKLNSSSLDMFIKRFYNWFNAFKVLKYLNYARDIKFGEVDIFVAATGLYKTMFPNENVPQTNKELLYLYRRLDKMNKI